MSENAAEVRNLFALSLIKFPARSSPQSDAALMGSSTRPYAAAATQLRLSMGGYTS